MKLVIAYIQPEKLNDVKQSLFKVDIHKVSVTNSLGCGQQMGYDESYRGIDMEVTLLQRVRLEIAITDDFLERTIDAIIEGASSGNVGDGKIFVVDLLEAVRIRTKERGEEAIG